MSWVGDTSTMVKVSRPNPATERLLADSVLRHKQIDMKFFWFYSSLRVFKNKTYWKYDIPKKHHFVSFTSICLCLKLTECSFDDVDVWFMATFFRFVKQVVNWWWPFIPQNDHIVEAEVDHSAERVGRMIHQPRANPFFLEGERFCFAARHYGTVWHHQAGAHYGREVRENE